MAYINPFDLLEVSASAELGAEQIKREKKRLLAEFELNDSVEIKVAGHQLDKATLLQLFEELEDEQLRTHHQKVAQHTRLLRFLQDASLDLFYEGEMPSLATESQDFLRFLGPYFASPFNQRLLHAIKQRDLEETEVLCQHPLPIPTAYQAACFQDSYRHLHQKVEEVDQLSRQIEKGGQPDGRVQEVCDEILIDLLNVLPSYFSGVRDRYGLALEGLALQVQNVHQRVQLSLYIVRQGLKLDVSDDTRRRLQYVLDQLIKLAPMESVIEAIAGGNGSAKKSRQGLWWVALGVGAAVWLLARWLL